MKGWEQIVLKENFFKQIITFQKPCTTNQELKQKFKIYITFNIQNVDGEVMKSNGIFPTSTSMMNTQIQLRKI